MIAIGSGGTTGKGIGNGSQSQLNFLPERHQKKFQEINKKTYKKVHKKIKGHGKTTKLSKRQYVGRKIRSMSKANQIQRIPITTNYSF